VDIKKYTNTILLMNLYSETEYSKYTILNKEYIKNSTECACIYCFRRFKPDEINEFCVDCNYITNEFVEGTAICPWCSMDAIIPNSLIKYTDTMLIKWHKQGWGDMSIEFAKPI